jgi:hypothetical protein
MPQVMLDVHSRYHVLALPRDRLPGADGVNTTYRLRSHFQQVTYFSYQVRWGGGARDGCGVVVEVVVMVISISISKRRSWAGTNLG